MREQHSDPHLLEGVPLDDVLFLMAGTEQQIEVQQATPLMDIYDNPQWRALREAGEAFVMRVIVLSAKHDWTSAFSHTLHYNDRISRQKVDAVIYRGTNIQKRNSKGRIVGMTPTQMVARHWGAPPWKAVISCGSGEYRRAFDAIVPQLMADGYIDAGAPHIVIDGTTAQQVAQIRQVIETLALGPEATTAPTI